MARTKRRRTSMIKMPDFSGITAIVTPPEGFLDLEVESVVEEEKPAGPALRWQFKIISPGKYNNQMIAPLYTSFSPGALFKLKSILQALEIEIPEEGEFDLDANDLIGGQLTAKIIHRDYEGRNIAEPKEFFPLGEGGETDEEDDEVPAKKSRKSRKTSKKEHFANMDEVGGEDDEEDEEAPPKKSRKSRKATKDDEENDEDEDSDGDEEITPPAKKGKKTRKAPPAKKQKDEEDMVLESDVIDMSEEELDELIEEWEIDLRLKPNEKIKASKKRIKVLNALSKLGVLVEQD